LLHGKYERASQTEQHLLDLLQRTSSINSDYTEVLDQLCEIVSNRLNLEAPSIETASRLRSSYIRFFENLTLTSEQLSKLSLAVDSAYLNALIHQLRENQRHGNAEPRNKIIDMGESFIRYLNRMDRPHRNQKIWAGVIRLYVMCMRYKSGIFSKEGALALFEEFQLEGFQPTLADYHFLMRKIAKQHHVLPTKLETVEEMKDAQNKRVEETYFLLQSLKRAGLEATADSYISLFYSCAPERHGGWLGNKVGVHPRWKEFELLMLNDGIRHTENSATALVKVLAEGGLFEDAVQRLKDMQVSGLPRKLPLYNAIIKAAARSDMTSTYALFDLRHSLRREQPKVRPNVDTYAYLMECCVRTDDLFTASQLVREMEQVDGLSPDTRIWGSILKLTYKQFNTKANVEELEQEGRRLLRYLFTRKQKVSEWDAMSVFGFYFKNTRFLDETLLRCLLSVILWKTRNKANIFDRLKELADRSGNERLRAVLEECR
jgi:pentatricopeptide repeat protein